ncbi:AfsR/SARP family transcriptional regulator [Catenulispora rubra]|uniref:AfsR/SARP family transcriptional regulator n=1 Tax=Catenulispora rubra TaxID=280293 RepID=UPI0018920330|nr:tetratricopeptide repeat protein [Catenulispora rubra]
MNGSPDATLEFQVRMLGMVQAVHCGTVLDLGGLRAKSILAVLMLHPGQVVPRRTVIAHAWPDDPPASAADLVTDYVSKLRRALAPATAAGHVRLVSQRPGFRADIAPDLIDAHRFTELLRAAERDRKGREDELAATHLRQALGLWRGEIALSDLDTPWLRSQADVLLARRLDAFEQLAGLYLNADDPAAAAALLREAVPRHPERDRMAALLVQALAALGEPGQAADTAVHVAASLADLGQAPGPHLRQAHTQALRTGSRPATVRGPLHQLPLDPPAFTGRQEELTTLLTLAEHAAGQDTPAAIEISAIDGMGGVGKTALALHAAHALTARFPDGQLFVDLQGAHELTPRPPGDVLAEFLQAYGTPPQLIPAETPARAAAFRNRLAGTRTLILLDNAGSEDQIRPLLPGTPGCLVLITSRKRLKGIDDAHPIPLDILPITDAVALFRTIAGPGRIPGDDPLLEDIARMCGQLPLALRITAAVFRNRRAWTLENLIDDLHARGADLSVFDDGDRKLDAIFDLSYQNLNLDQQRLFRYLGLVPGPDTDAYAAAALTDTDLQDADRLLQDLTDHNLLTETSTGRYRLHDLLRLHARTQATTIDAAGGRATALDRLLHYYAHTAQTASGTIARRPLPAPDGPGPDHARDLADPETARAWLRIEYPNLDAAFTLAHTGHLEQHVIALADGLAEILNTDGPWTRAMHIHQAAETAARHNQPTAHATALNDLGLVRRLVGDYPGAAQAQEEALEIFRQLGHRLGEATALNDLGLVRYLVGDYPGAAQAQEEALEIFRQLGNRLGEANALNDLGLVRYPVGDYPGAANALEEALEIYQQLGHRLGEASVLNDLGRVRYLVGDYPGAVQALEEALEIFRQLGHRLGEATALNDLGQVRYLVGDYPGAAQAQEEAMEIYRQLGHRGNEAWALNPYAATVAALGDRPRALALYQQALAMNRELGKPDDEAIALEGIAEHHLATGNPTEGAAYLNQALEIYRRLGMQRDIERAQTRLAELDAQ